MGEDLGEDVIDRRNDQVWPDGLKCEILGQAEFFVVANDLKGGRAQDLAEGKGAVDRAFDEFGFQGFGCVGKAGEAVAELVFRTEEQFGRANGKLVL